MHQTREGDDGDYEDPMTKQSAGYSLPEDPNYVPDFVNVDNIYHKRAPSYASNSDRTYSDSGSESSYKVKGYESDFSIDSTDYKNHSRKRHHKNKHHKSGRSEYSVKDHDQYHNHVNNPQKPRVREATDTVV